MNKPKPQLKRSTSAVINKRTLSSDQSHPQIEFNPDQLREITFRCGQGTAWLAGASALVGAE